jgi:hypothetical protein
MGYRQFFQKLPIPWLVGRATGQKYWGALGDVLDEQVDRLIAAVQARFPSKAPTDALPYKASERQIFQGSGESEAAFRERLRLAWNAWDDASKPGGLLAQLWQDGYTDCVLLTQNGLFYKLNGPDPIANLTSGTEATLIAPMTSNLHPSVAAIPTGSPWAAFDNNTECCSRFAILLPTQPSGWTAGVPTASRLADMRRTIQLWRPGKAKCVGIYALTSGRYFHWPITTFSGITGTWAANASSVLSYSAE